MMGEARLKAAKRYGSDELKFTLPPRSGSYPLMNIANDFGVPYEIVLNFADAQKHVLRSINHNPDAPGDFTYWHDRALEYAERMLPPGNGPLSRRHFYSAVINQQCDFLLLRGDISRSTVEHYTK